MICKPSSAASMVTPPRTVRSRLACALLALTALAVFCPAPSVTAGNKKIIVIRSADLKPYQDVVKGLTDECGCDVQEMTARSDEDRNEIIGSNPTAVVVVGTAAFKKVRAITGLPVVYAMVIPSETAPPLNSNISGVSIDIAPDAYLAVMKTLFPKAKRIGVVYDPRNTTAFVRDAAQAASAAGMELVTEQVRDLSMVPGALSDLKKKTDVLWMVPDPTVVTKEIFDDMLQFSFRSNIPIVTFSRKYVEMGAVASLDIDPYDMGVQAGSIVNNLTAGRTPVTVYARKYHLTVNKKVASKMGFAISDGLLSQADDIE